MLVKLGADNTKTTDNPGTAKTDVTFTGNIVEVDPSAVVTRNDSLCTEDHTVLFGIGEAVESCLKSVCVKLLGGLSTKAYEDLVCVVMVMIVMMTARAVAVLIIFVMMLMLMLVIVVVMLMIVVATLAVVMMMLMLVVAAFTVVVVMLVIVVAAFTVVMMLMIVVAALAVVMMVMMLVRLLGKLVHFSLKGGFSLHSLKQLRARKLLPRGGNDNRVSVVLLE